MSKTALPFTSPLGPIHHAHPSEQGASLRALLSLFRRHTPTSSRNSSTKTSPNPSGSSLTLDCTFEHGAKSTYAPSIDVDSPFSRPPPPYSPSPAGLEEDLLVIDEAESTAETQEEKEQRRRMEKLEERRRELVEVDRKMSEALKLCGL